jgi:hypothetical protein
MNKSACERGKNPHTRARLVGDCRPANRTRPDVTEEQPEDKPPAEPAQPTTAGQGPGLALSCVSNPAFARPTDEWQRPCKGRRNAAGKPGEPGTRLGLRCAAPWTDRPEPIRELDKGNPPKT